MMILYAVILNEVKNLEVSVAVDGSASLEILRCTQDDTELAAATHAIFRTSYFEIPFFMPIYVRFIRRPLY